MPNLTSNIIIGAVVTVLAIFACAWIYTSQAHAGEATWTGAYVGVLGSYDQSDVTDNVLKFDDKTWASRKGSLDGGLFGLQAGYGRQLGMFYAGMETDWQWGDISDSKNDPDIYGLKETYKTDQFGTIRGRVGVIFDQFMPYVTGGVAIKHGEIGANYNDGWDKFSISSESWRVGYVVGGGVEWRPMVNWSFKVEALYSDFGEQSLATISGGGDKIDLISTEDTGVQVRAGVAYHF
jgi:outer membrane immunogenic protein